MSWTWARRCVGERTSRRDTHIRNGVGHRLRPLLRRCRACCVDQTPPGYAALRLRMVRNQSQRRTLNGLPPARGITMNRRHSHEAWLNEVLPGGLAYPSSTLISGPGGSGKPLIGFAIVYDWLTAGGNVIFMPLQYPNMTFVRQSLQELYGLDLDRYDTSTVYVQFAHDIDTIVTIDHNTLKANLLKPDVWSETINRSEQLLAGGRNHGNLVFASALNLLLFSGRYKQRNVDNVERLLSEDKEEAYVVSVSASAFREDVQRWEEAADNLLFARLEEPMRLYLRIDKVQNRRVAGKEVAVPMKREILEEIKMVAEGVRKREIRQLRQV